MKSKGGGDSLGSEIRGAATTQTPQGGEMEGVKCSQARGSALALLVSVLGILGVQAGAGMWVQPSASPPCLRGAGIERVMGLQLSSGSQWGLLPAGGGQHGLGAWSPVLRFCSPLPSAGHGVSPLHP